MYTYFHNDYLYSIVELQRCSLEPYRQVALKNKDFLDSYFSGSKYGRTVSASFEMFERITRDYPKPEFGIKNTLVNGKTVKIDQKTIHTETFCKLLHFKKDAEYDLPKMLIVAPMSGHHATLLRGTVEGLLPHFDVYITDWINARDISTEDGLFTFDDFVRYVTTFVRKLGQDVNILAVCQPSVPVSAAVAIMSKQNDPCIPQSMTLMGGPIDTRKNPTEVNDYAAERTIRWFESNAITKVPLNYTGAGRSVYPGFMQLYGFMAMNLKTHVEAHWELFNHLVDGDGDSADSHKKFYNEYLSVMDLPAEFYLETINLVFKKHLLPRGKLVCDGVNVNLGDIEKTSLLCIEGERDDISGRGQTKAAIELCKSIPADRKKYHLQKDVGHYGIFNGKRYRDHIVPLIVDFVKSNPIKKPAVSNALKSEVIPAKVTVSVSKPTTPANPNPAIKKEVALEKKDVEQKPVVAKTFSNPVVTTKTPTIEKDTPFSNPTSAIKKEVVTEKKAVEQNPVMAKTTPQVALSNKIVSLKQPETTKPNVTKPTQTPDKTGGNKK